MSRWSDQAFRIYGLEPQSVEPSYELFLRYVHPDDLERVRESTGSLFHGARSLTFDHRIIRADGTLRDLAVRVELVMDDAGHPLKMVGISQDITDRKRAEEVLRLSEERFRSLADSAPVGIFLADAGGLPTYVNPRCLELTGLTMDAIANQDWSKTIHPEDLEQVVGD